jgi:hypothetical protein
MGERAPGLPDPALRRIVRANGSNDADRLAWNSTCTNESSMLRIGCSRCSRIRGNDRAGRGVCRPSKCSIPASRAWVCAGANGRTGCRRWRSSSVRSALGDGASFFVCCCVGVLARRWREHFAPNANSLVARRLGIATGGFYASPRYLASRGAPTHPRELLSHDTIAISKPDLVMEWPFSIGGKRKLIPVRPRLVVTDLESAARAAAAGMGIVRAPFEVAEPYLAKKALVAILREWTLPGSEVHALLPPGGGRVPKTRVFVDMLEQHFAKAQRG